MNARELCDRMGNESVSFPTLSGYTVKIIVGLGNDSVGAVVTDIIVDPDNATLLIVGEHGVD